MQDTRDHPPVVDPARVARESEDQADGERWPWLTEVRVLDVRDLADAPRLSALDIETTSMMRRTRLALGQDRRRLLLEAFGRG